MLRMATKRSATSKRDDHAILCLQWIGIEDTVLDLVTCVREGAYTGPVITLDDFSRQRSRIPGFTKPTNRAIPEPDSELAIYDGFKTMPDKVSMCFVGHETPAAVSTEAIKLLSRGAYVVYPEGKVRSRREAMPRFFSGAFIAAQIV